MDEKHYRESRLCRLLGNPIVYALGRKEYFVDLLFYHRFLKALVAFDLKIGSFEPEHAGKMDFYLNVLNEKERGPTINRRSASSSAPRKTTWKSNSH